LVLEKLTADVLKALEEFNLVADFLLDFIRNIVLNSEYSVSSLFFDFNQDFPSLVHVLDANNLSEHCLFLLEVVFVDNLADENICDFGSLINCKGSLSPAITGCWRKLCVSSLLNLNDLDSVLSVERNVTEWRELAQGFQDCSKWLSALQIYDVSSSCCSSELEFDDIRNKIYDSLGLEYISLVSTSARIDFFRRNHSLFSRSLQNQLSYGISCLFHDKGDFVSIICQKAYLDLIKSKDLLSSCSNFRSARSIRLFACFELLEQLLFSNQERRLKQLSHEQILFLSQRCSTALMKIFDIQILILEHLSVESPILLVEHGLPIVRHCLELGEANFALRFCQRLMNFCSAKNYEIVQIRVCLSEVLRELGCNDWAFKVLKECILSLEEKVSDHSQSTLKRAHLLLGKWMYKSKSASNTIIRHHLKAALDGSTKPYVQLAMFEENRYKAAQKEYCLPRNVMLRQRVVRLQRSIKEFV
jgi:hypothetical protein